jgi:hypothetical protein
MWRRTQGRWPMHRSGDDGDEQDRPSPMRSPIPKAEYFRISIDYAGQQAYTVSTSLIWCSMAIRSYRYWQSGGRASAADRSKAMPAGEWMTTTSMREWCQLNGITITAERRLEAQNISVLSIPPSVHAALNSAGVGTVGQLIAKPWPEIWAIASLDAFGIERVQQALRRFVFGAIEDRLRQATKPIPLASAHRRRHNQEMNTPPSQR